MKKKMVGFLFGILVLSVTLFMGVVFVSDRASQKAKRQEKIEEGSEEPEEETKQYKFENLGNIYYLPEDDSGFKKQVADFLKENHMAADTVNVLGKYQDDPKDGNGIAEFYLQLNDKEKTILKAAYDKGKDQFFLSKYDKEIENIEDYGGVAKKEEDAAISEPEYSVQGTEDMDFGLPVITDNEEQLVGVESNFGILQSQMLQFLQDNQEERRNISVLYAEQTEGGYEAAFVFENPRKDGKYIQVSYDVLTASYQFQLSGEEEGGEQIE